jgi:hypothetical protein
VGNHRNEEAVVAEEATEMGAIVDRVVAALIPAIRPIDRGSAEARDRRDVQREVDRQIGRAVFRAERRARQVPRHVRRSASYVNKRRRQIAYEVSRAVRSLGAGDELARAIAERAALRYPRDGVVLPDATARSDRPRARGEAPRQTKTNPRAVGRSPRQEGVSPRQRRRAAADLSGGISQRPLDVALPQPAAPVVTEAVSSQLSEGFTQAWDEVTRSMMADMRQGINVTKAMSKEEREKFYARVREIRRRDHRHGST